MLARSLGASFHLKLTSRLALLPFRVGAGVLLPHHYEERFIFIEGRLGVIEILIGLCELFISISEKLRLGFGLLLPCNNLIFLCCLELLICLDGGTSSFWVSAISFIWFKIPKISPDCGA